VSDAPHWRRYLRFARPNVAADVDEELEFHIAMRTERNLALGMTADDARRDALRRFGDPSRVRHALVEHDTKRQAAAGRREYLMDLLQDLRFGWRSLRRAPSFTLAATFTLALGIGANAAIFSIVDAVVLRPLPYERPDELLSLGTGAAGEYLALRERLRTFSQLAAYVGQTHPVDDGREAHRVEGAAITTNLLATLGVTPLFGRGFTEDEAQPGRNNVLLISYGLWQERFGGRRDVVDRQMLVEGVPHTIVGVMPSNFHFPDRTTQYWQPYAFNPARIAPTWTAWDKKFIGRVAKGVTIAQATREVRDVWPTLRMLNPVWDPGPTYRTNVAPTPLQDDVVGATGKVLWILFGCVVLVLLIGCVNVANLLLARATARERELSVRAALGGGRGRLMRQLVTESLLLSTLGGALGVVLAYVGVRWLVSVMPAGVPRAHETSVNGGVLAFTAATCVVTGILFGVVPAVRATRFGGATFSVIGFGRRSTRGAQHHRIAGVLVASEIALAVLLVIGATLLVRSFSALRSVDPGFRSTHVVAARLTPPNGSYRDTARVTALYNSVVDRLAGSSGVTSVAVVDKLPMAQAVWGIAVRVEGQFEDNKHLLPTVAHFQQVTPTYFGTMGIPLRRGRQFTDADRAGQLPVAIISESVARQFWPKGDAIGKRIAYPFDSPWLTIVGVVPDTKQDDLRDTARTSMYVPWAQRAGIGGNEMWVVASARGEPAPLARTIRAVVRDVDRTVAVSDVRTMEAVLSESVQRTRFTVLVVGAFAIAALLLGAVGIFGVMSYLVGQRTQEMGIRIALGAPMSSVLGLVVGRAARLAAVGTAVGVVAALFATRSLRAMLYGVSAGDPVTFVAVPLLFLMVAVVASSAPAARATRVDPIKALRAE
jgi:putative ABC transport system permease protein